MNVLTENISYNNNSKAINVFLHFQFNKMHLIIFIDVDL